MLWSIRWYNVFYDEINATFSIYMYVCLSKVNNYNSGQKLQIDKNCCLFNCFFFSSKNNLWEPENSIAVAVSNKFEGRFLFIPPGAIPWDHGEDISSLWNEGSGQWGSINVTTAGKCIGHGRTVGHPCGQEMEGGSHVVRCPGSPWSRHESVLGGGGVI